MEIYSIDYFVYLMWLSNPLSVTQLLTLDQFRELVKCEPHDASAKWAMREALYQLEDEELYEWCAIIRDELLTREI